VKKAVIQTGNRQHLVQEGETIEVELLKETGKILSLEPMLIIDGETTKIGTPIVADGRVDAEVVAQDKLAEKVTSIRYKAKKRVSTIRGHRQHKTVLRIKKIQ
jgi:large subunit ribosomal protein L21